MKNIKLKFNIWRFKVEKKVQYEKEKISTRKVYLIEIFINIIAAFTLVSVLYLIEYFTQYYYANGTLSKSILSFIKIIPKPSYPDDEGSVFSFISLLASVAGLLLALFYPILATIVSSGYAKTNNNVRGLIFNEPTTQHYVRRLAFLTAYSIWTLLLLIFDFYPGNLILIVLSLLSLITLFNLLKIGKEVYNLFQPETLAKIANKQIAENIRNITIQGGNWNNQSFQFFFRRKVERNLEILKLLNFISVEELPFKKSMVLRTIGQTLNLFEFYLLFKSTIPLNSKWFKNKTKHKSYFEADISERQLALNTETYIYPKEVPNHFWFEEEILDIYRDIGAKISALKDETLKYGLIKKSLRAMQYFGSSFAFDLADKLILENLILTKNSLIHNNKTTYQNSESNLILIETLIMGSIRDFHLVFFNTIEKLDKDKFNNELAKINWLNRKSLYKPNLPSPLYKQLEEYFEFVIKEKFIEGKKVTPNWYIVQHISAEYLLLVEKFLNRTIQQVINFALPIIKECEEKKNHLALSFACHCTIDNIEKIKYRIPIISNVLSNFDSNNVHKGYHKWSKIDQVKINDQLEKIRKEIIPTIAINMNHLVSLKWNEDYPDVFAHSYKTISKELNNCFKNDDTATYEKLFPYFLKSSLHAFFKLYIIRYKERFFHDFEVIYQFHIELMQISGVSYIYSEVFDTKFWNITVNCWDEMEINKTQINLLVESYKYYRNQKSSTGINFTDNLLRTNSLFETIEIKKIDLEEFENNLVRGFVNRDMIRNKNYEEIFLEMYLFTFIDAKESIISLKEHYYRNFFSEFKRLYE